MVNETNKQKENLLDVCVLNGMIITKIETILDTLPEGQLKWALSEIKDTLDDYEKGNCIFNGFTEDEIYNKAIEVMGRTGKQEIAK